MIRFQSKSAYFSSCKTKEAESTVAGIMTFWADQRFWSMCWNTLPLCWFWPLWHQEPYFCVPRYFFVSISYRSPRVPHVSFPPSTCLIYPRWFRVVMGLRLYPSHHRADFGLSPVRNVRRRAHQKPRSDFWHCGAHLTQLEIRLQSISCLSLLSDPFRRNLCVFNRKTQVYTDNQGTLRHFYQDGCFSLILPVRKMACFISNPLIEPRIY